MRILYRAYFGRRNCGVTIRNDYVRLYPHLLVPDEELLKGGIVLSEWFLSLFEKPISHSLKEHVWPPLSPPVRALKPVFGLPVLKNNGCLLDLADGSPLSDNLKTDLHNLRKYRNSWIRVDNPRSNNMHNENAENIEIQLECTAFFGARVERRTIYSD